MPLKITLLSLLIAKNEGETYQVVNNTMLKEIILT